MRGVITIILIILAFGLACLGSGLLGDLPRQLADQAPLITFGGPGADQLDGTAQALREQALQRRTQEAAPRVTAQAQTAIFARAALDSAARSAQEATWTAENRDRDFRQQVIGWTATADAARSTQAARASATEAARAEREENRIAQVQETKARATAQAVENKARNDQLMSLAWAVFWLALPVSILVIATIFIGRLVWHKTELILVRADSTGKYPLALRKGKSINGNLQALPVMDSEKPAPEPSPTEIQIKDAEQKIDAVRALPRTVGIAPALPAVSGFSVLDQNALPPAHLLQDAGTIGVIDGDWSNN